MITQAQIKRSQFDAAIGEYMKFTSKSTVEVINGKARDLLFKAYKNTPYALYDRTGIEHYYYNRPKIISAICNKKYGLGSWTWEDWSYILKRVIGKAMSSKSYMRSGFLKGARGITATVASTSVSLPKYAQKFTNVTARNIIATATRLRNDTIMQWGADSGIDASQKEQLLNKALQAALPQVTADIAKYLQTKLIAQARKNSGR